ncbi:MAG: PP2C family protein-serine/threonine phosphatase [Bacteroidia bacterium]
MCGKAGKKNTSLFFLSLLCGLFASCIHAQDNQFQKLNNELLKFKNLSNSIYIHSSRSFYLQTDDTVDFRNELRAQVIVDYPACKNEISKLTTPELKPGIDSLFSAQDRINEISAHILSTLNTSEKYEDPELYFGVMMTKVSQDSVFALLNYLVDKQILKTQKLASEEYHKSLEVSDRNRNLVYLGAILLLFLLVIFFIIYKASRTKTVLINKLESLNKEVTDSITYAKKIQHSILPREITIKKHHKDYFVLYQPKDIVSGDFYSFFEKNGNLIFIVADCTGHGVPGALMSMVGANLIDKIINEKDVISPSGILTSLNKEIISALHQNEIGTKDGMDIIVCVLDSSRTQLRYAGANRPLWIFRGKELIEYKASKCPIGGAQTDEERNYQEHLIELQPKDNLYLFSDGYADQFSSNDKKLMTKKFKEKLSSIQGLSMAEQGKFLLRFHNEWKGPMEQTDDVLVMGIRV